MMFNNRTQAAQLLLKKLEKYKGKDVLVAGIPRGAMPMARIIADGLGAELTAILVHKISSPGSGELAIGCVGLSGIVHQLPHAFSYGASQRYIETSAKNELEKLRYRQQRYRLGTPDFKNKVVIIVDDGIATGATTICAVEEARTHGASKVILATPVSSLDAAEKLLTNVDELVVLYVPEHMFAIGEFYNQFEQVSDDEVIMALHPDNGKQEAYP